jgi:hypothetical protein
MSEVERTKEIVESGKQVARLAVERTEERDFREAKGAIGSAEQGGSRPSFNRFC